MGNYVMKMPDVGEGVVEAEVVEWLVQPGDMVSEDQHIVDVMTEKATMEITSPVSGTVVTVYGEPGDVVAVGAELIELQTEAEEVVSDDVVGAELIELQTEAEEVLSDHEVATSQAIQVAAPVKPKPVTETETVTESAAGLCTADQRPLTSPSVRRRAREANVDLIQLTGTGRNGRISHADLDGYITGPQAADSSPVAVKQSGTREVKVIGLRRAIAQKVALSKRSIPHFSYVEELDLTELDSLRRHLNGQRAELQVKLTYLPFLMLALTRVLKDFPQCNAHFDDAAGVVTQYHAVHLGIATQTDMGLKVPVVKHAEALDLDGLAERLVGVSEGARNSTSSADEMTGSTITITSLGALGGLASTPVINHPEVAIIGVNKMVQRAVVLNGQIVPRLMMNLSCSFDHRVVDGYDAAQMIQALKGLLEHPATMFM
ncbi:MAG TPA: dihydrolipoamide acetyltransferase family protein [Pseudomonadales bacterium]|nr:dihydrolipoamide acetyltransferase family protein [Pseudomonadales bacterium]